MPVTRRCLLLLVASAATAGCSPTLDWREIRPDGEAIVAMFPCRPDRHERRLALAAGPATMRMLVCSAGNATFALSYVDVAAPAGVTLTLTELRTVAAVNVGAASAAPAPLELAGATAYPEAGRVALAGRLPDGGAVKVHAAFFAKGLRVYQASVIGAEPSADAIDGFFSGLRFPPAR